MPSNTPGIESGQANIEIVLRSLDRRASHEIVVDSNLWELGTRLPVSLVERNTEHLKLFCISFTVFRSTANVNQCRSLPLISLNTGLTPPTRCEPPQSQPQWFTMVPSGYDFLHFLFRTPKGVLRVGHRVAEPGPEPGRNVHLLVLCTRFPIEIRS